MRGDNRAGFGLINFWGAVRATRVRKAAVLALTGGLLAINLAGSPKFWQGDAGSWHDAENWLGGLPETGDEVWITNHTAEVLLTNTTPVLSAFNLERGTLVFTNWNTALRAQQVEIADGGVMTLPPAFMESQMSNRVWVVCSNLTLAGEASIDVSGKGYAGGAWDSSGHGPGKGEGSSVGSRGGGAGYGGLGGWGHRTGYGWYKAGGTTYGSFIPVEMPGSGGGGGGYATSYGGDGGGLVRIEAEGQVLLNGTIFADGQRGGSYSGGGSGGGVQIVCHTLGGQGTISANGAQYGAGSDGGSGGGGRVALQYSQLILPPAIHVEAREYPDKLHPLDPITRWTNCWTAAFGSIAFSDVALLPHALSNFYGRLCIPGVTSLNLDSLTTGQGTIGFPPGFDLRISQDLAIQAGGALYLENDSSLTCEGDLRLDGGCLVLHEFDQTQCAGDLVLTNGGCLYAVAPIMEPGHECQIEIGGDIHIGPESWILPTTHLEQGTGVQLHCRRLLVAAGGGIDADGRGLSGGAYFAFGHYDGLGPGGGFGTYNSAYGSGGGHGGRGGWSWRENRDAWHLAGGEAYGSSNIVPRCGSGGGTLGKSSFGGHGGGSIWVDARESVQLEGVLTANGGAVGGVSGGGSGGGIFIDTLRFSGGETALVRANGSNPGGLFGGPGGGGRILIAVGLTSLEIVRLMEGLPARNLSLTHPAYQGGLTVDPSPIGPDYTGEEWRSPLPGSALFSTSTAGTMLMVF